MEFDCGGWINLLSHKVKKRLTSTLSDLGITGVQSHILFYIMNHAPEGPVFQKDVEEFFELSRSTATGILQNLERNGVIQRNSVPYDARLKSLVPTKKAEQMSAQVQACILETERAMTRGISPGQQQLFKEIAAKMSENLDAV